jgi:tRNA threonylcarbamoyladenosine biosynthesis protein TsaB
MTLLALEFSSDRRSVAVARDGRVLAEVVHQGTLRTPIFALIEAALTQAGVGREAIEAVGVGLGPGSYTGVRLAISVAQGWQLATGVKTIGVNSLANLAAVAAQNPETSSCLLAVDAQKKEFAVAEAKGGKLISDVRLAPAEELKARLANDERIAGPDVTRLLEGGMELFPSAAVAACLATESPSVPAESLAPVYLREVSFVKAPAPRSLAELKP